MTITIETLQQEHAKLGALIEAFTAQAAQGRAIEVAAARIHLYPGEHYAGVVLDESGEISHHLVLLAPSTENVAWEDARAWAANQGGELPSRAEQSLLFANLKGQFEGAWYWSSESHEDDGSCAWGQLFSNGTQDYSDKIFKARARAVRLIPLTA